jgi:hypothetical protein
MTTTNLSYSKDIDKHSVQKARASYKISLDDEPKIHVTLGTKGRGGRGLGRYHKVREFYIDQDKRVYAGFMLTDSSGHSYRLIPFGRLITPEEDAK